MLGTSLLRKLIPIYIQEEGNKSIRKLYLQKRNEQTSRHCTSLFQDNKYVLGPRSVCVYLKNIIRGLKGAKAPLPTHSLV